MYSSSSDSSAWLKVLADFFDTLFLVKFSLVILSPPLLTKAVKIVTNNFFCDTCHINFVPVTGNWCALFCGISMHSLSIIIVPFVWCQISFFDSWPYLRVLLQLLKSMFFTSMVYIFPALMISIASSSVNALIHFLTSQLFIPVTNLQKISSLFNTH